MNRRVLAPALTIAALTFAAVSPAGAAELFSAGGWIGEGRIATGPAAALERGRCRVQIKPDDAGRDVSITGQCAVAVGLSDVSLRVLRGPGGKVNAGVWTAATGQNVQFSGQETKDRIVMAATTPVIDDGIAYETRVEVAALPAAGFSLRQLMRAEGATAWRLVVDMDYRPAD